MTKNIEFETINGVVLFTDVHNFSVAAVELSSDMPYFLQETYEILGDIIVDHQGSIIKYLGDALLCLFETDSEDKAVTCGRKMREAFSRLVSERNLPPETELEIGIGSGKIFHGVFGHKSLTTVDIFGEEVNRAAMIGHHRGIAITEPVYQKIKTKFKTRPLPDVKLKWLKDPIKVWEVE